jgi:Concanavalin A-like lectin/glucanases superfamily
VTKERDVTRGKGWWSAATVAAMVVGIAGALVPGPSGAAAAEAIRNPDGELVAPDLDSAVEAAATTGERVLVEELTDERTLHRANPDGTVTLEQFAAVQRIRSGSKWVPVDTTLRVQAGRVVPAATLLDLSLSAGGTGELVVLRAGETRLGLSWPRPLPAPVLSGDTATYPEVLPGVDLRVRAEPDSFSQVLVVKTRQAAANPALARIAWAASVQGGSLRLGEAGVVEVVDGAGERVFHSPASSMWDSPVVPEGPTPGWPVEKDWGGDPEPVPAVTVPLPVELSGAELAVLPDPAVLADPATVFPVYIDPPFSRTPAKWTHVNNQAPNTSYEAAGHWSREYMRVGHNWDGSDVWRTHIMFGINAMAGQQLVNNPTFSIRLYHSASCASTPVRLYQTGTIAPSGITWNYMADKWGTLIQERSAHANKAGGCGTPQPNVTLEFSNATLRERVQASMDQSHDWITFGLRAPSESDRYQWKKFLNNSAALTATYNLMPNRPTNLAVAGDCFQSCASPAILRADRPTLQARVVDPNRDVLDVQFQVVYDSTGQVVADSGTSVSNRASGTTASWRTTALPQDQWLRWRVRARDVHNVWGPWGGWFEMLIDTTAPFSPLVGSSLYRHVSSGTWNGGIGVPGQFTFDPNTATDVVAFEWKFLDGNVTRVSVNPGATRTVSIAPAGDLRQTLQVRAIDRAGNTSGWSGYSFLVRPQPTDVAHWKFDEGTGLVANPTAGGGSYQGALQGGAGWTNSGLNPNDPAASGKAVALAGTGWVEMPNLLDTTHPAGFSVSAWVYPTSLPGYRTVLAQEGENEAMFRLEYRPDVNAWCFTLRHTDSATAATSKACASQPPRLNQWTSLVGVYDPLTDKLRLYVNGPPSFTNPNGQKVEVDAPAPWRSTGLFSVGLTRPGPHATAANYWNGHVDEVRAHQRILTDAEVLQFYLSCRLDTCPPAIGPQQPFPLGFWELDDWAPVAADESRFAHDATLSGPPGTAWTEDGRDGAAVRLDGVSGAIETAGPVVPTDFSFTVATWVRPSAPPTGDRVVLSQSGANASALELAYRSDVGGWCFTMRAADNPAAGVSRACGPAPVVGDWTHLAGVYDAAAGQLRLYVNGQPAGTASHTAPPWPATGPLTIGSNGGAGFFAGDVDRVRVYLGALTHTQVAALTSES